MNKTLNEYIERVRSKDPTPGGGSVSALGGALASSLTIMVSALSKTKKIYKENLDDDTKKIYDDDLEKLIKISDRLIELVELDCEAYNIVAEAFKIPKDDDKRDEKIQAGLKYAADIPFETCKCILDSMRILNFYITKTIKGAITDLGTACAFLHSSYYGAELNVKINLESIADEDYIKSKLDELKLMEKEMHDYEVNIFNVVKETMKY